MHNTKYLQTNKKKIVNQKLKVGLVHGVFDIMHIGHIEYFKVAKKLCDKLIVSVTTDKFVNKGSNRPAFALKDRIKVLQSIKFIYEVIISNDKTAVKQILKIKPDFYIKGKDYEDLISNPDINLKQEISAIKKVGGKFIVTQSKLKSSSKILNEQFNFLDDKVINFLKKLNISNLQKKLKNVLFTRNKLRNLIMGEPILDRHTTVTVNGRSQKTNAISSSIVENKDYGGGIILPINFLNQFYENTETILFNNTFNKKIFKKYINKKTKVHSISEKNTKIIIKQRYIDNYIKNKLFQINHNEAFNLSNLANKKFLKKTKSIIKNFDNVIIFDYGYGYFTEELIKFLSIHKKKLLINCQTNSSNFGYNLISKYNVGKIVCIDETEFRLSVRNKTDDVKKLLINNKKIFKNYEIFIVTMGSLGCYVCNKNKIEYIPTVFIETKDTTGCGDIFFASFIFFYSTKNFSLKECAFLSHIASGIHAKTDGNQNNISKDSFFKIAQTVIK